MPTNQIGKQSYPYTRTKGGQKIWVYEDHFVFVMQNEFYHTAGHQHWREKVKNGELTAEGIGLNVSLYKAVMKSKGPSGKDFIIYNKKQDSFYRLSKYNVVASNVGIEKKGRKKLAITPKDAYKRIRNENKLDENIRRLRSN